MMQPHPKVGLTKVEEASLARWRRGILVLWLVVITVTFIVSMFKAGP